MSGDGYRDIVEIKYSRCDMGLYDRWEAEMNEYLEEGWVVLRPDPFFNAHPSLPSRFCA